MARDPADLRASPHASMADADLGNPAELPHSHRHSNSLPNVPSDLKESNSLPNDLNEAEADDEEEGVGAAAGQRATGRHRSPLSVCSAPAHVLEALRPRAASDPAASGSPLRTVSESPRTERPWIMRHMSSGSGGDGVSFLNLAEKRRSLPRTTYYNRSSMTSKDFESTGGRAPMASEVEPGELAQLAVDQLQGKVKNVGGFNFRDIAGTAPLGILEGMVYRSSQVFTKSEMDQLRLKSALDLREEPHACKKAAEHNVITGVAIAPVQWLPDRLKLHAHRSLPMACSLCSTEDNKLYHRKLNVFHVDLLPPRMKLQIFVDMPWRIRLKTCLAPLAGKSPQEVMTPAVADPTYLGYAKLYRMMLDLSMRPIARALRVFAHAENLPIIIHCIHGKDRTGLIIALLLLLLGVDEPTVVLDYAKSELELKGGRDRGAVKGVLQDYLVTDSVVASTAQTMEDTLRFLDTRFGGIKEYLRLIGITRSEVRAIRRNLLCDNDTSSLRNLGVTGEDDDEEDEGRGAKIIKPVKEHMNHLFRPNRDDPGPHHFKHHRAKKEAQRKEAEGKEEAEAKEHAELNSYTRRQQEQAAEERAEEATM